MGKWYDAIGFETMVETEPGLWEEQIEEHMYYGEVTRNSRRLQSADKINDDINISNQISIVADPFAVDNIYAMRYAKFMGTKWKVTDIEVQYPRLLLTLGGLYNE